MVLKFIRRRPWDVWNVAAPWGDRPSIHRHLVARLEGAETSLSRSNVSLPDEEKVVQQSGGGLRWVAGALDGVVSHHIGNGDPQVIAGLILKALAALTQKDTSDRANALYSLLTTHSALEYVDGLLPMIAKSTTLRRDRVQAVARWLATGAADREAVKAAIAILGVVSSGEDREVLITLGKHEEFTLFAVVALGHSEEDPEPLLWEVARCVTGWGRIHSVKRLAATHDDRIKSWLLREGFRNDIMDEYTALVCAKGGDLVSALRAGHPDPAVLKGAGAILAALIRGGPAEDVESYSDGPEAIERYLAHLRGGNVDLEDLRFVATIEEFVAGKLEKADDSVTDWHNRAGPIQEHLHAIMDRPDWPTTIQSELLSEDRVVFSNAAQAAKRLGIDTWEVYFERLTRGEDQWYFVMQTDDPIRIDRVVSLAEERLPLKDIATGPADELGLGLEFQAHSALDFVLQDLRRFPGKGWPLIRAGLQSRVTRNRNMAVRALAAWGRSSWPAEAELLLRQAMKVEPNVDTRASMRKVVDGEQLH
jgi:hypothetical protein